MSSQYTKGIQKLVNGNIALLSDDLKIVMVDTAGYTADFDADEFLSAIPAPDRVATSPNLASKTITIDTATTPDQVVFDCADFVFSTVSGDPTEALVLYKDTGDPATSPLIAYFDGGSVAVTPNGNNVNCTISATGLLRWQRTV